MEQVHVHDVYNAIADHFDETRVNLWPGVVSFLEGLDSGSRILDIGCGNGKYLNVRKDCNMYACDPCERLVAIATGKRDDAVVKVGNGLDLPFEDEMFDAVISVAVFHHLDSVEHRVQFLHEVKRVLKTNGKAYITVWGKEALKPSWMAIGNGDVMVPWHDKKGNVYQRYYHLFEDKEIADIVRQCQGIELCLMMTERENWHFEIVRR